MPLPWDAFEGYATNFMADFETAGTSDTNLLGLELPDLTCVDTTWPIYHSPRVEGDPIPSTQTKTLLAEKNENRGFEDTISAHSTGTDHDCGPEAYDVLNSLSSPRFSQAHPTALPAHFQPTSNTWNSHHAPFDQILRLNRESSDRLGRLLTCSCARRPHLGFLYASIITLILTLYQQAAGCSQTNLAMDPSLPGSESSWSNKIGGTNNAGESGTTTLNKAVAFAPQPAQITMGSFKIDDQEVKAALTIQLLLGEIKHAGRLINLLRLRSSSDIDGVPFDSVDNLYRSLRTWLGSEHSRLVETLKSRLLDIST